MIEKNNIVEPWVGTKEIAEHLGVTIETIRKWIKTRKIPCHRVGKLWKFKVSEIDDWVLSGGSSDNN